MNSSCSEKFRIDHLKSICDERNSALVVYVWQYKNSAN